MKLLFEKIFVFEIIVIISKIQLSIELNECNFERLLEDTNAEFDLTKYVEMESYWNYSVNMTKHNEEIRNRVKSKIAEYRKEFAKTIKKMNIENIEDENFKRQLKLLARLNYEVLSNDEFNEIISAISAMEENFSKIKICQYKNSNKCDMSLEPEIRHIFATSQDLEEIKYYWVQFYNSFASMRKHFDDYIRLNRKAAKLNNYNSGAEVWLSIYEDPNMEKKLSKIFAEFKPFYDQFHGYVRWNLRKKYGEELIPKMGSIPLHVLRDMWGENWQNVEKISMPFPDVKPFNVTEAMIKQGYTPKLMYKLGDEFFTSIGLLELPSSFWKKSVIEKLEGRQMKCHAEALDFYMHNDVRILMCTQINMEDLITVHHELGHIQYYLQYQSLPHIYKEGANPGFHEAMGDVLGLAVSTPKHLQKLGLLENFKPSYEEKINRLYRKALEIVAFLPFAYTIDLYRWGVFRNEIKPNAYNCAFWKLRNKYSGVKPPAKRTENHFDPPSKNHISEDVEYLRYLVANIIEFQFYKTVCEKAGQYDILNGNLSLSECDFYGNTKAGSVLGDVLSMGSSREWPDAMEVLTGQREMSIKPLMEYFAPLQKWIEKTNKENNVDIGWNENEEGICG